MDIAQAEEVTWHAMWRHMTCDCEAALVLRLALDDANSGVVAAAAAALHALLESRGDASQDHFPDPGESLLSKVFSPSVVVMDEDFHPCEEAMNPLTAT